MCAPSKKTEGPDTWEGREAVSQDTAADLSRHRTNRRDKKRTSRIVVASCLGGHQGVVLSRCGSSPRFATHGHERCNVAFTYSDILPTPLCLPHRRQIVQPLTTGPRMCLVLVSRSLCWAWLCSHAFRTRALSISALARYVRSLATFLMQGRHSCTLRAKRGDAISYNFHLSNLARKLEGVPR